MPNFYSYLTGSQQAIALGLPVEMQWNITSMQGGQRLLPNMLSFNFNTEKFRTNLKERAKQHIKKKLLSDEMSFSRIRSLRSDKENLNAIMSHPEVMREMQLLEQSDSIRNALNDNKTKLSDEQIITLQQRLKKLEDIEAKRPAYEALLGKKRESDKLQTTLSNYDTIPIPTAYDYNMLDDPQYLKKELASAGLLSKSESAGLLIERFQFGRILPYWSELALQGAIIDGIDVAVAPRGIYAGGITGIVYPIYSYGFLDNVSNQKRSVLGAAVGYGSAAANHFRLNILQFKDDADVASPKSNHLLNALIDLNLFKDKVQIRSSIAGSQTTYDRQMKYPLIFAGTDTLAKDDPSEWLSNILQQKHNSMNFSTDYAYTGDVSIHPADNAPAININIRQIGTYYQSFGVPFLSNDISGIEGGLHQNLWHNRITINASLSSYRDNLKNLKPYTTGSLRYRTSVRVQLPSLPSFILIYSPVEQTGVNPVHINFWMVQSSWPRVKNRWNNLYSATYIRQSNLSENLPGFSSDALSFQAYLQSPLNFQFLAGGSYFKRSTVTTPPEKIYSLRLTPRYTFFKRWRNGIGVNLYYSTANKQQAGINYETSLNFLKRFSFTLRAEYDKIKSIYPGEELIQTAARDALFISAKLSAMW